MIFLCSPMAKSNFSKFFFFPLFSINFLDILHQLGYISKTIQTSKLLIFFSVPLSDFIFVFLNLKNEYSMNKTSLCDHIQKLNMFELFSHYMIWKEQPNTCTYAYMSIISFLLTLRFGKNVCLKHAKRNMFIRILHL